MNLSSNLPIETFRLTLDMLGETLRRPLTTTNKYVHLHSIEYLEPHKFEDYSGLLKTKNSVEDLKEFSALFNEEHLIVRFSLHNSMMPPNKTITWFSNKSVEQIPYSNEKTPDFYDLEPESFISFELSSKKSAKENINDFIQKAVAEGHSNEMDADPFFMTAPSRIITSNETANEAILQKFDLSGPSAISNEPIQSRTNSAKRPDIPVQRNYAHEGGVVRGRLHRRVGRVRLYGSRANAARAGSKAPIVAGGKPRYYIEPLNEFVTGRKRENLRVPPIGADIIIDGTTHKVNFANQRVLSTKHFQYPIEKPNKIHSRSKGLKKQRRRNPPKTRNVED